VSGNTLTALAILVGYSVILIGIGLWGARKAQSGDSYLIGSRSLGPVVAGLAYAASSSSAWVLLGFSGFVYVAGPSALWMVPGILAGYGAVWLWAGPLLQRAACEERYVTFTDFLSASSRPGTARLIRLAASLMIAFCFSYYVASQFQGAGIALTDLFDLSMPVAVIIGAGLILVYVLLGGFLAVSLVDTFQGLLMALIAVILPVAALVSVGGWEGLNASLSDVPPSYLNAFGAREGMIALGFVLGLTATGFGALGQPHLIAWIMAARDDRARITGASIAIGWAAVVYSGMAILGLSARVIFGDSAPPEGVFFALASDLLPALWAGIITAVTLAAIMSTVDSQLLVVGAAISHDMRLAKRLRLSEVLVSRLAIVAVSVGAIILTLNAPSTIFDRTLFAWTALGASFGPIVVMRALGHRASGGAALASMLIGFGLSLAFEFILPQGPGSVYARILPWMGAFMPFLILPTKTLGAQR
jgi:Na+/proline symporter